MLALIDRRAIIFISLIRQVKTGLILSLTLDFIG